MVKKCHRMKAIARVQGGNIHFGPFIDQEYFNNEDLSIMSFVCMYIIIIINL